MTSSTDSWLNGTSGDWSLASAWSGGAAPLATATAVIATQGSYVVTLFAAAAAGGLTLGAAGAEFYDAGVLTLGTGTLALNAGTLALAYGTVAGGTLAVGGGHFQSSGGTLDGTAVQGTLDLSAPSTSLFVRDGMALSGAGGAGAGSIMLTGSYAALNLVGSQTLANATVSLGGSGSLPNQPGPATLAITHAGGATAGATLTLAGSLWVRQVGNAGVSGIIAVGNIGVPTGPTLPDMLVNQGTITASVANATLDIAGSGSFANQGTLAVSNGATLELATAGFSNAGTISVNNATLALGGTFSATLLANLGRLSLSAGHVDIVGTADDSGGTLALGTGSALGTALGAVVLGGTVLNGTVTDGGGGLSFAPGTGVLDGTAYVGTLNLAAAGAAVTLTDGASVVGSGGGSGTILDTGAGSALLLRGAETLDRATISLGNAASSGAAIGTSDSFLASSGTTATLGPNLRVQQVGLNAALKANGWSQIPGFGAADTLVNQGTITGNVAGGKLSLSGYGTIVNSGSIAVGGGDVLAVTVAQFTNSGTITANTGGTILLGQPPGFYGTAPSWSNTGQIAVAGGTLALAGSFATSQLGSITQTGGMVSLAGNGTLSNAGATLTLGAHGAPLSLQSLSLSGTILGGTIADAAGVLAAGTSGTALLDGVSDTGTLALTGTGAFLRIRDGLTLTGVADILGVGSMLDFVGSQTLDRTRVLLGAAGKSASIELTDDNTVGGSSTLTLGSGLSVVQSGALAAIGRAGGVAGDTIVNAGTITAAVLGGTLTLGGPAFVNAGTITVTNGEVLSVTATSFSNTGSISVAGGRLSLAGSLTLAGLGTVSLGNSVLGVSGAMDLGGGTLSLGAGSAIGQLALTGTLSDGTIVDAGHGLSVAGNATLDDVTYVGTLDLSRPFSQVSVADGLSIVNPSGSGPGSLVLTGAVSRLLATTSEQFDDIAITLGSGTQTYLGQRLAAPELAAAAGVQLTLGSASTLTLAGTGGVLGDASLGQWSDSIVNAGQISAAVAGTLTLGGTFFTNTGTIAAASGGVVTIGNVGFANAGLLSIGAGSAVQIALYDFYAAPNAGPAVFTNSGTIAMTGGLFQEQTGNGVFPAIPIVNLSGASIQGNGLEFAQVANAGTIEAMGGTLQLAQFVSGNGSLQIDASSTLELVAAAPFSEVIRFAGAGGTLKIDAPSTFAGTLSGFAPGDFIDLPNQVLTAVGSSSGTLVLSTATQSFHVLSTTPIGGLISAGHDSRGGALVSITPQSPGSGAGPLVVAVSQANMLFWASPLGDAFHGTMANLNGASIGNWSAADSIDLTDLAPAGATLSVVQGTPGHEVLTIGSSTHQASIGLGGTYAASGFHLSGDGSGGTLLTYGHG